jgi:hypothetical protein
MEEMTFLTEQLQTKLNKSNQIFAMMLAGSEADCVNCAGKLSTNSDTWLVKSQTL